MGPGCGIGLLGLVTFPSLVWLVEGSSFEGASGSLDHISVVSATGLSGLGFGRASLSADGGCRFIFVRAQETLWL